MEEPRWQTVSNLSIIRIWVAPWHGHHARGCVPGFDEHDDVVLAASQCNAAQKNKSREYGRVDPRHATVLRKVYHHPNLTNRSCARLCHLL
jgi:hypothetical protein